MRSKILLCELEHARFFPVRHTIRYPMAMFILDLDEIEELPRELSFFRHNRFNVFAIHDKDYVLGGQGQIKKKLLEFLVSKGHNQAVGKIELVTAPRYLGRGFNPVSFYYCYRPQGGIAYIVAEVNNPFGERHFYVLEHKAEPVPGFIAHYRHPVEFQVSPFIKPEGDYEFHFSGLEDPVDIRVTDHRRGKIFFFARFTGKTVPLTRANLLKTILRHPLLGAITFPRIVWQALILYFRKKLPVFKRPEPRHAMTYRLARPSLFQKIALKIALHYFSSLEKGQLTLVLPHKTRRSFGGKGGGRKAELHVYNYNFFTRIVTAGDIGFGESFMQGEWDSPDATELLRFFIDNQEAVDRKIVGNAIFGNVVNALKHFSRANTQKNSRRNIRDHYDLGNAFYERFLDPSMTYSSGILDGPGCSLERAQENKLDAILAKAGISKDMHVLEIGCGWGSFAIRAVQRTGCRVTGITLSEEQKRFAEKRITELGLSDRIEIQLRDYRDVEGSFDRIVSIEMIEAVGHAYLELFFKTCDLLLMPGGIAVFQAITIPDDRYETYRKRSDWIQKHIFPGGMLPSPGVLRNAIGKTSLKVRGIEPFGPHYARTLFEWRENFKSQWPAIKKIGFDEVFRRKWEYYFYYCESGFASGIIDVVQIILGK